MDWRILASRASGVLEHWGRPTIAPVVRSCKLNQYRFCPGSSDAINSPFLLLAPPRLGSSPGRSLPLGQAEPRVERYRPLETAGRPVASINREMTASFGIAGSPQCF